MSPAEDFVLWSNLPDERIEVRIPTSSLPATGSWRPNTNGTTTPVLM